MNRLLHGIASVGIGLGLHACAPLEEGAETRPEGPPVLSADALREARSGVDFGAHVKPILEARCLHCHDGRQMPGKYDLSSRSGAMAAGPSGPRIVPGHPEASLLISFISEGNHAKSMPSVGLQVPAAEIDVLRDWIRAGARWPDGAAGRLRARDSGD